MKLYVFKYINVCREDCNTAFKILNIKVMCTKLKYKEYILV